MYIDKEIAVLRAAPPGAAVQDDDALFRRISWRLMPLLFICYLVNYLDRTNVGYAQLQMREVMAFSDAVFGLGAAAFFAGYMLFEIPSNILLQRIGAKRTMLRIMVLWGLASACTMFVATPTQFYAVRFLVGVFEAGFAPGVLYYLTLWFPPERRARANALFLMGFGFAPIVAGPIAGSVMTWMHGLGGLQGWQWLFLIEGVPSVLLGIFAWYWLDDRPADARWLTPAQRERVRTVLRQEPTAAAGARRHWSAGLRQARAWGLGWIGFLTILGVYALAFWQPTLLKGLGLSLFQVGMAAVLPALAGAAAALWLGGRSDRHRERRGHYAMAALLGAGGLTLTALMTHELAAVLLGLSLASAGLSAAVTIMWAGAGDVLPPEGLAAGIALITTCSSLSGVAAPLLVAAVRGATGGFTVSLLILAGALVLAAVSMYLVLPSHTPARKP
ncbi:MAG: MFS transporter [Pseudomonadota bacterium]